MKRSWKLLICLAIAALALSACSGEGTQQNGTIYAQYTQYLGPTATPTAEPTAEPIVDSGSNTDTTGSSIFSANPYDTSDSFTADDALGEENYIDPYSSSDSLTAQVESTVYVYAGATPIPLDPVDLPSPTPHPELSFTYVTYTAGSLGSGLTFEAPSGWIEDNSQTDVYTVTEPESQMHNGQQCVITLSAVPVTSNYSEAELKKEVTQRLKDIGAVNFVTWDPSLTASRYLMGSKGVYANYTGTLATGVELGGRIHYTSIDNVLYGIEILFPREYREDYLKVYTKIKDTIQRQ
ncbi:MAG: hypothetical protein PHI98_05475 [Eubacteriales bacterium]|nr:hypothetical protein [Eubacteriales bacterium]